MMWTTMDDAIAQLKIELRQNPLVMLRASPGMGKTTQVPSALLDEDWLAGRTILMLEPRRLATRAAASFMASMRAESVGQTVGYRIRAETKVSTQTRIELLTDGVFTRMIQEDPTMNGVGLVIFDEFHERSIHSELALALLLQARTVFALDIRILLMSATLSADTKVDWLQTAPLVTAERKSHPLTISYVPPRSPHESTVDHVCRVLSELVREPCSLHEPDDVLVFLPGVPEIHKVIRMIGADEQLRTHLQQVQLMPLHGQLAIREQAAALTPLAAGKRKIVLATSVAETSVTVEGVRTVIDSGRSRLSRYSIRTGFAGLDTVRVSLAAAVQRAGRAGRTGPGRVFRLWHPDEERTMQAEHPSEMATGDLTSLALELLLWGARHPDELRWSEPPSLANWERALACLRLLGAITDERDSQLTAHGRAMAAAGVHPRFASMLLRAHAVGWGSLATELTARFVHSLRSGDHVGIEIERLWLDEPPPLVQQEQQRLVRWLRAVALKPDQVEQAGRADVTAFNRSDSLGIMLAWAFPDRVAQPRSQQLLHDPHVVYLKMANGRGCKMARSSFDGQRPWCVVVDAMDEGEDAVVRLVAQMSESAFQYACGDQLFLEKRVFWDNQIEMVRALERLRFGECIVRERPLERLDDDQVIRVWQDVFRQRGLRILHWSRSDEQWLHRMRMYAGLVARADSSERSDERSPDRFDDDVLIERLSDWLGPALVGCRTLNDLQSIQIGDRLSLLLDHQQLRQMQEWVPTHWHVPSGSRIPIHYEHPHAPVLAVRLQEMFGSTDTPRIAGGRVALVLHLLSPANRPVQVTSDLAGFWRNTYPDVRKELRGRYPKHVWPDDPLAATPTARAKPRTSK